MPTPLAAVLLGAILLGAILLGAALGFFALPFASFSARLLLVLAAAGVATAVALTLWRLALQRDKASLRVKSNPTRLVIDTQTIDLVRPNHPPERMLSLVPGFGLTWLTTADRTRLSLAVTTGKGLLCVGSHVDSLDRPHFDFLKPHALAVSPEDMDRATQSPFGDRLMVDARSLLQLVEALTQIDPEALGRILLTDGRGREVLLDHGGLATPHGTIRFDQPFEWRAIRFREGGDIMPTEFQGTWIRQGTKEIVLVSLLPEEVGHVTGETERGVAGSDEAPHRDARLARGSMAPAPPVHQRVAVDRWFMLPLRRALDGAHDAPRAFIRSGLPLD